MRRKRALVGLWIAALLVIVVLALLVSSHYISKRYYKCTYSLKCGSQPHGFGYRYSVLGHADGYYLVLYQKMLEQFDANAFVSEQIAKYATAVRDLDAPSAISISASLPFGEDDSQFANPYWNHGFVWPRGGAFIYPDRKALSIYSKVLATNRVDFMDIETLCISDTQYALLYTTKSAPPSLAIAYGSYRNGAITSSHILNPLRFKDPSVPNDEKIMLLDDEYIVQRQDSEYVVIDKDRAQYHMTPDPGYKYDDAIMFSTGDKIYILYYIKGFPYSHARLYALDISTDSKQVITKLPKDFIIMGQVIAAEGDDNEVVLMVRNGQIFRINVYDIGTRSS